MYNTHECASRIYKDNLEEDDAFALEIERIKYYRENTNYRLTNICDGGEGTSGYHQSEEQKKHLSLMSKKKWKDPIFKDKMLKIRKSEDSPYKSKEFREKISSIVSGSNNPNYNNRWSEEQKNNLSIVRKKLGVAKDANNPNAKTIICLETGEIFECIKYAMDKYNVNGEASFTVALKERQKTAANLHWMFYEDKLENDDIRFYELIKSLSLSQRLPMICVQTKEIFINRKVFFDKYNINIKCFKKQYSQENGIVINNKNYMYIKDYIGRFTQ